MSAPTLSIIHNMIGRAFKQRTVTGVENLQGGLINTNLLIHFDDDESVVLRIYRDGADTCRKEMVLHQLVQETVPVVSIIHAEPDGIDGSDAFAILEYVDAITLHQLRRTNNREAIGQAASSAGKTLANIGRHQFSQPGRIQVDSQRVRIGERFVDGDDGIYQMVNGFLESPTLQQRLAPAFVSDLRKLFAEWSPRLAEFNEHHNLVHCDFGNNNLLVSAESGRWQVAAVLDWELAISGSPLLDIGHFLRYDYALQWREPYFSRAFIEHGGSLPADWQSIVRVLDLTALIECLTHEGLPADVKTEIMELMQATLNQTRE